MNILSTFGRFLAIFLFLIYFSGKLYDTSSLKSVDEIYRTSVDVVKVVKTIKNPDFYSTLVVDTLDRYVVILTPDKFATTGYYKGRRILVPLTDDPTKIRMFLWVDEFDNKIKLK